VRGGRIKKSTQKVEKIRGVQEKMQRKGNFLANFLSRGQQNGILPPIISNSNMLLSATAGLSPGEPDQPERLIELQLSVMKFDESRRRCDWPGGSTETDTGEIQPIGEQISSEAGNTGQLPRDRQHYSKKC
jgi:hypothetical protein